jgi:hypothetical protein
VKTAGSRGGFDDYGTDRPAPPPRPPAVDVARLAVVGLGTDDAHQAVEEILIDVNEELRAVAEDRQ